MRASIVALVLLAILAGLGACERQSLEAPPARVALVRKGPAQIELVPAAGQPLYCLVFTLAETGVIRHLTIVEDKLSPDCPAGEPIARNIFRIPPGEGKVRIVVIFSDRALESDPIGVQIQDLAPSRRPITAMDLRAPGRVIVETLEFSPSAD